jgi:hypothetical protein
MYCGTIKEVDMEWGKNYYKLKHNSWFQREKKERGTSSKRS